MAQPKKFNHARDWNFMESKYIYGLVLYAAGGIAALGWWYKKKQADHFVDYVLVFFGYPLVLLFKFGQLLAH
jgi:tryptophan-rich sensory protein